MNLRLALSLLAALSLLGCGPQPGKSRPRGSRTAASASASTSSYPVAFTGAMEEPADPIDALKARTYALAVQQDVVHAGTTAGVVSWSFQDKAHPKQLATVVLPGSVAGLTLLGASQTILAVSVGPSGLALVDVSNAQRGRLQTLNSLPWSPEDRGGCYSVWATAAVDEKHALLACGTGGVAECDVSDPARPRVVQTLAVDGYVRDVVVLSEASGVPRDKASPRKVAVAAGQAGLVLAAFPQGEAPKVLARLPTTGEARALELHGGLAYVADGPGGLRIVDVQDPARPVELSRFDPRTVDLTRGVTVRDQTAFLCLGDSGLMSVDASNPRQPRRAGGVDPARAVNRARTSGNLVLAANDAGGILVLDASRPDKLLQLFPPPR